MFTKTKKYTVAVIGSGVVGYATGKGILSKGHNVLFVDVNKERVEKIKNDGYQAFTPEELAEQSVEPDITILTVPTPTIENKIELKYLKQACTDLGNRLKKYKNYHLVVSRSTLPPGTNREIVTSILEELSDKKLGTDFGLCMNPEYLREVSAQKDFANPWVIVIGQYDEKSGNILADLYKNFKSPIYRTTIEEAEMQKYIHNLYNATKIAFFNEFRDVCKKSGINPNNIFPLVAKSCEGMWNPSYGIKDLGPFMGSCLPKDTQAMSSWALEKGIDVSILDAVIESNKKQFLKSPLGQDLFSNEEINLEMGNTKVS